MINDLRLLYWPEEDRASFAHFSAVMADVQARIQAISGDAGGVPVPVPPRVPTPRECAAMILQSRREVRRLAGEDADLFGDPAWEIILAVFEAEGGQADAVLLESIGLSPHNLVGRRWVALLIERGWIERTEAGHLCVTDKSRAMLHGYFTRL